MNCNFFIDLEFVNSKSMVYHRFFLDLFEISDCCLYCIIIVCMELQNLLANYCHRCRRIMREITLLPLTFYFGFVLLKNLNTINLMYLILIRKLYEKL